MKYYEKINVSNAKKLLGLSDVRLKEILDPEDDKFQDGEELFKNIDTYIKSLRYWIIKSIGKMNNKGFIETEYQYSKKLRDCGRIYVKPFGIQKVKKNIRGYLIKDEVVDLDMINAHPSILLNILETKYKDEVSYKFLKKYVDKREYFLKEEDITKQDILISMNSNKKINHPNKKMIALDYEFKKIQKHIFNNSKKLKLKDRSEEVKENLKQNKEGKFLNHVLTVKENEILEKVIKKYRVQTPMFDGFTIDKNHFNENTIKELNNLTKEEGVKWAKKDHDESININDDEIEDNDEYITYEEQKIRFEEKHFMVENPIVYGRFYNVNGEEKYQLYGKDKFRELVKPIKFFDGEKKEFFPKWLEDEKRLSYREIQFIPTNKKNEEIFNSFTGFNYSNEQSLKSSDKLIELFKQHISILTNHEKKSIDYLINFIAHLIQKPEERPETIILLKSNQGYGKDTLINLIAKLIGEKYFLRTAEIEDIFGSYNVGLRDTLFLQLNELEGKDGFSNKEKIKNLATEDKTIIREKYISQYDQKNYLRIFICSNNFNPVEIPFDDRRMTVFQATRKKPSIQYFNELNKYMKDKDELQNLFNYLNNIDISDFSPSNDRPITKAYENMKDSNQNPIYKYLYDNFISGDYKETFDKEHVKKQKKNNKLFIQSNVFYSYYKEHLSSEDLDYIKPTFKIIKSILLDLGIEKKSVKIGGKNNDYYIIDVPDLEDALKIHNVDEKIEEYDETDFE